MKTDATRGEQLAAGIDWSAIHRRLEAARAAIARGGEPAPDEQRAILTARATVLAQAPHAEAFGAALVLLTFRLAFESYGLEAVYVREVISLKELTPLPCTPPFVAGIINVRGQILSVVDIRKFFELPEKGLPELSKVIILHSPQMEFGLLADAILGMQTIPLADLQAGLPTLTDLRAKYLKGVGKDGLVVLDAGTILADPMLVVRQQVGAV
jgi:purine-binding chemotaxis protein CheW